MVAECTGTVLCERNSRMELSPSRSSNQPGCWTSFVPVAGIWRTSSLTRNHDLVATNLNRILFERRRRWPGNHFAIQVVHAVMARAPDLPRAVAVLHGAVQMRAHSGTGFEFV